MAARTVADAAEAGEPMPEALIERINEAANFNQGFATGEYLASALMDMVYHTTDPAEIAAFLDGGGRRLPGRRPSSRARAC